MEKLKKKFICDRFRRYFYPKMEPRKSLDDQFYELIRLNPPFPPSTREEMLGYYRARLEAIGFENGVVKFAKGVKVIHVAGTKGKGSTCAMVESILRAKGLRTALFTSPHLVSVNERFRINGKPVEESTLEYHFKTVVEKLKAKDLVPGFFACLTLIAFHLFKHMELDAIILEVGMGGRLDATNVLEPDAVTVCGVTLLDLDHTEFLGDTIEKIAAEKAGIFKQGVPVYVVEGQEPGALQVLMEKGVDYKVSRIEVAQTTMVEKFVIGLEGDHQKVNAALAVALCKTCFPSLSEDHIAQGLAESRWPGRAHIEQIGDALTLFLDGAHTPKSVFCATNWYIKKKDEVPGFSILLFNCMYDRSPIPLFESLKRTNFDLVLFAPSLFGKPTRTKRPMFRDLVKKSQDQQEEEEETWQHTLAKLWNHMTEGKSQIVVLGSLQDAIAKIESEQKAHEHTTVFVTGSLLLIGDLLKLMNIKVNA